MSGTGSMALGNWDAGEGNYAIRRWVRDRLLEHVPPRAEAVTMATIAARAEMEPHAVSDHLRCMSVQVGTLERANRKTRYYRREEDDMPHEEHDRTPLPERLAGLLAAASRPTTVVQMAGELCVRPNTVSKMLIYMVEHGTVKRDGAGHRGDPYRYKLPSDDEEILTIVGGGEVVKITGKEEVDLAEAGHWPIIETGTLAPPESGSPMDRGVAYDLVIEDLRIRAEASVDEAKIMSAARTLLMRILDGEAGR